jgi:hypothetical protein
MSTRILYTIRIYENSDITVEQHQRSLDPMKDAVVSRDREFLPAKASINVTSPDGGRLVLQHPPKANVRHGSTMSRISVKETP